MYYPLPRFSQPPDMYVRVPPMPPGYPDSMPVPGIPGYLGGHAYSPSPQYPVQYPYTPPQRGGVSPSPHGLPPSGGMVPPMDGYGDSMRSTVSASVGGGMSPYPPPGGGSPWTGGDSSQRSGVPPGMSRWSGQVGVCFVSISDNMVDGLCSSSH